MTSHLARFDGLLNCQHHMVDSWLRSPSISFLLLLSASLSHIFPSFLFPCSSSVTLLLCHSLEVAFTLLCHLPEHSHSFNRSPVIVVVHTSVPVTYPRRAPTPLQPQKLHEASLPYHSPQQINNQPQEKSCVTHTLLWCWPPWPSAKPSPALSGTPISMRRRKPPPSMLNRTSTTVSRCDPIFPY